MSLLRAVEIESRATGHIPGNDWRSSRLSRLRGRRERRWSRHTNRSAREAAIAVPVRSAASPRRVDHACIGGAWTQWRGGRSNAFARVRRTREQDVAHLVPALGECDRIRVGAASRSLRFLNSTATLTRGTLKLTSLDRAGDFSTVHAHVTIRIAVLGQATIDRRSLSGCRQPRVGTSADAIPVPHSSGPSDPRTCAGGFRDAHRQRARRSSSSRCSSPCGCG